MPKNYDVPERPRVEPQPVTNIRPRVEQQPVTNLLELLDRILDKGIVIIGDIKISVADIELLKIQIRLLICSVDKAKELGIDFSWARGIESTTERDKPALRNIKKPAEKFYQ